MAHIYVMNADGSEMRAITAGPSTIANRRGRATAAASRFHRIDWATTTWDVEVATGAARQLTRHPATISRRRILAGRCTDRICIRTRGSRGVWTVDATTGAEASLAPAAGAVSAPAWSRDGSKVVYNVIVPNRSELMLDGRDITGDEDVFPFRAQWTSPNELIYTADGKIKKRPIDGGSPSTIEFRQRCRSPRALQIRRA